MILLVYKVPDDIRCKPITSLKVIDDVIESLKAKGFKTIEDVIKNQTKLSKRESICVKAYLMFDKEYYDPVIA